MPQSAIPDVVVGDQVIDAKFPCKKKVPAPLKGSWPSDLSKTATDMTTSKETDVYTDLEGIKKVKAMTPREAAKKKGNCDCTYVAA